MNKRNWKNETKQQTRKREFRPFSRDSASTRRQVRAGPVTAPESRINFMVNVSSSGTNFNKQIELELARLDSVEKKIRKHKCKATGYTCNKPPSSNTSNQRKLRNILESMMATMDYAPPKLKKYTPFHQKVRLAENDCADAGRRCVKPRKNLQNPRKVESFTNFIINNNKRALKSNVPKMDSIFVKSAMKKPMSAPSPNHNSVFADDLRFAESLRFGKNIDLHFMLSDMKKMVQSSNNNFRQSSNHELTVQKNSKNVKFGSATKNFKVIIEKPSRSNISYIYDSSSFDCVNAESLSVDGSKWPTDPIRTLKKISSYDSEVNIPTIEKSISSKHNSHVEHEKEVKEKPEPKEFYSYLRRGNFTISGHIDEHNNEDVKEQNFEGCSDEVINERCEDSDNSDQGNKSPKVENEKPMENQGLAKEHVHVSLDKKKSGNKTFGSEKIERSPGACDFPTELLERSILAVENVLNTIDSMANEFRMSTEIRDPLFVEVEAFDTLDDLLEDTSMDQLLKKLTEDGLGDTYNNDVEKLQDIPDGDQLSKSRKYSSVLKQKLASIGSFTISKPTILCSGDSNSVQGTSKISHESAKNKGNSFSDSLSQIDDILYLKPPVKYFLNSEENFPESVSSSIKTKKSNNKEKRNNPKKPEYVVLKDEEDVDPLMMALESLRTRVNAIEEEMVEVSPKRSSSKPHGAAPAASVTCTNKDLRGKLCSEESRQNISVRQPLNSKTFSDTSCRSLPTSQSDNNFTLNQSYSVSCSSNGSRASSCRKCFIPPSPSSKVFPRASNRIFNTGKNRANGSFAGSFRESNKRKPSKIFPDYYIDRCMKLLRKKFKDFDKLRRGKMFGKKSNDSLRSYTLEELEKLDLSQMVISKIGNETRPKSKKSFHEQTEMLWINNTQENYKVCFKNEHFNNRSETSIESYSKEVTSVAKKKNVYTISRIKSSP